MSEPVHLPRQVLEALDDAALVTDAEGKILWASARVETLWGYRPAETLNKKLQFLVSFESSDLLDDTDAGGRASGRPDHRAGRMLPCHAICRLRARHGA